MRPRTRSCQVSRNRRTSGQALVELALVLPLLFLLIVNVVNFGTFLYAAVTVADAARAGADYLIMGGATVDAPGLPDPSAKVLPVVQKALSSLPNAATAVVNFCTNDSTTGTAVITCTGTSLAIAADPEPAAHISGAVDITYTYQPLIPLWSFPSLNIYSTLPATTIHRQALMRIEI